MGCRFILCSFGNMLENFDDTIQYNGMYRRLRDYENLYTGFEC